MGAYSANYPVCYEETMKQRYFKVGNKYYFHDSVIRLIDRYSEISQNPEEIIRSLVHDKLNAARQSRHSDGIARLSIPRFLRLYWESGVKNPLN